MGAGGGITNIYTSGSARLVYNDSGTVTLLVQQNPSVVDYSQDGRPKVITTGRIFAGARFIPNQATVFTNGGTLRAEQDIT